MLLNKLCCEDAETFISGNLAQSYIKKNILCDVCPIGEQTTRRYWYYNY